MTMPVLYGLPFGLSSISEKQPQSLCSTQAALKAATSGPSMRHISSGAVLIDNPCNAYSGKTTRSRPALLRRALPTIATMRSACAASCAGVSTTGSCSCTRPMTTPFGDLLRPPRPLMPCFLFHRRQLARAAARDAAGTAADDEDDERQHVRHRREQVVA